MYVHMYMCIYTYIYIYYIYLHTCIITYVSQRADLSSCLSNDWNMSSRPLAREACSGNRDRSGFAPRMGMPRVILTSSKRPRRSTFSNIRCSM